MHSFEPKPRVLFVGAFPPEERAIYGGVISSCRALVRSELSQHVEFVLLDSTQQSQPPPSFPVRLGLAAKRFAQFIGLIIRERPDATLIFCSAGASVFEKGMMAWVAKALRVPVLLFPRAGRVIDSARKSNVVLNATRLLLRSADVLLCQSHVWQQFACSELKLPLHKTLVIENWTASPEFLAVGSRRQCDAATRRSIHVIFVGWLEREKGVFELLEAFGNVNCAAGIQLTIVGDGNARDAAHKKARELGIADQVRFLGWLSSEALCAVFEESDIFVLPSWTEGLPNAMIEAMAARLPVIVSNVGGIPDVIDDGSSGYLVEPRSPEQLARVLQEVVDRSDVGRAIADAGFEVARQRFSIATAVQKFRHGLSMAMRLSA